MSQDYKPTNEEFREAARRIFAFLVTEFRFKEEPFAGPFTALFRRRGMQVAIIGGSYGFSLGVRVSRRNWFGRVLEELSLHQIVEFRAPERVVRYPEERDQINYMRSAAVDLRECAGDFLHGDVSGWDEVATYARAKEKEHRTKHQAAEFNRLMNQASDAFRAGEYRKVIQLLEPHVGELRAAHAKTIVIASRKTTRSSDGAT